MLISILGQEAYGGVEWSKYRRTSLDFLISRTWNLRITDTDFKFIKLYTDYRQFTLKIRKFRRSCRPPFSFLQSLLTCGQSFMITAKLHKLRTLYKWIKAQYITNYSCSKPHNRIIKSKPSCKIWYKFLTCLAGCCT